MSPNLGNKLFKINSNGLKIILQFRKLVKEQLQELKSIKKTAIIRTETVLLVEVSRSRYTSFYQEKSTNNKENTF